MGSGDSFGSNTSNRLGVVMTKKKLTIEFDSQDTKECFISAWYEIFSNEYWLFDDTTRWCIKKNKMIGKQTFYYPEVEFDHKKNKMLISRGEKCDYGPFD